MEKQVERILLDFATKDDVSIEETTKRILNLFNVSNFQLKAMLEEVNMLIDNVDKRSDLTECIRNDLFHELVGQKSVITRLLSGCC